MRRQSGLAIGAGRTKSVQVGQPESRLSGEACCAKQRLASLRRNADLLEAICTGTPGVDAVVVVSGDCKGRYAKCGEKVDEEFDVGPARTRRRLRAW